jgi:hypothetical protein
MGYVFLCMLKHQVNLCIASKFDFDTSVKLDEALCLKPEGRGFDSR